MKQKLKAIFKGPVIFYPLLWAAFPIPPSMLTRWLDFRYGVYYISGNGAGFYIAGFIFVIAPV
ncbi:MAG: hypothetical protein WB564_04915 [Dehalococcoidia bacterium]